MPTGRRPRRGSLQYWPRKRASKILPSVNWKPYSSINFERAIPLGFIAYKAGMVSVEVKDNTQNSLTKGKKIIVPATLLECPPIKIFSVRFYNQGDIAGEILNSGLEKELKKIVKLPKEQKEFSFELMKKPYDDIRIIIYSQAKKTKIKKTPDCIELALSGSLDEKKKFIQDNINKELEIMEIFQKGMIVDVHGVTKAHGFTGPVKRFGVSLKSHKSEKGRRRPGSLGPWHPSRVTFRAPMAGQYGYFSRVIYNNKILDIGKSGEQSFTKNLKHFGNLINNYILIYGSLSGPVKRPVLLTAPMRISKKQEKKNYEVVDVRI